MDLEKEVRRCVPKTTRPRRTSRREPTPRRQRGPRTRQPPPPAPDGPDPTPDLPGCRPIPLRRRDLDTWDGRFEYWDGATETAWVVRDPTGLAHEQPVGRLVGLCTQIAQARGADIECYGTTDLELRDQRGRREKILQADQLVYVYPTRARLPEGGGIVVGTHDLPDVVLEVDYTTDVRPWKLGMYESWGFPEVWVEVPQRWPGGRRRGRSPGLTIHVLEGGRYRESRSSRAFPGWSARAIHYALNEVEPHGLDVCGAEVGGSEAGRAGRHGPGRPPVPALLPGREPGGGPREDGARDAAAAGIAVSEAFPANVPGFAETSEEVAAAATLACDSEEDFRARIRGADQKGKAPGPAPPGSIS